jgi:hypothetical protein
MADGININLRADSRDLRAEFGKAQKSVKSFGKDTSDSLKRVMQLGAGLLSLRAGAQAYQSLVGAASDLGETLSKTAAIFGDDNSITKWAEAQAEALGLSQKAALDYASRFGGALKEIGGKTATESEKISQELVGLTADLASFFNSGQDESRDAIAGALTGEYEMLKKYNVIINETILKERALAMGLSDGKGQLDARTKQLVTLDLLFKKTADAQGDFAKTSEGVANQQRILSARLENAQAVLGEKLIPLQLAFVDAAGKGVEILADLEPEIEAVASAMVSLTNFLVENRKAIGAALGLYVTYRATLKAIDYSQLLAGLVSTALRFRTSTAAIQSETVALQANTAAKTRNAGASAVGGGGGKSGAVAGGVLTAFAGYEIGKVIGEGISSTFSLGPDSMDSSAEQKALAEKLNESGRDYAKIKEREAVAIQNAEFARKLSNEASREAAEAERKALEARAKQQEELRKEVIALSQDVFKSELEFLAPEEKLARLDATVEKLVSAAEESARGAGLGEVGDLTPGGAFAMAETAYRAGDLEASNELLKVAKELRTATEKRAELEKQIAQSRAEEAAIAAENERNAAQQTRVRRDLAIELQALQLEANGRGEMADQLREEFDLRKEASRIANETGISEERALSLLREKARLEEKIAAARKGGLEAEREVVARGIFKLERNSPQRLRGIPDIGSGGIRESVKRSRGQQRLLLDRGQNQNANTERLFERLIDSSEGLREIWQNLNTV